MKKMGKNIVAVILLAVPCLQPLFAADTTETFAVGVLTNFETYYSAGFSSEGHGHGPEFLIGGGITETLSYTLTVCLSYNGEKSEVMGPGAAFIWTVVSINAFSMDIMPRFSFEPNRTSGELVYTKFTAFSSGIDCEFNITALQVFQPYLLAGFSYFYDHETGDKSWSVPLAMGALVPVKDGVEFLLQLRWSPEQEATWYGSERTIVSGFNIVATENIEVITEVGWEFNNSEFTVNAGMIYAL